jgi:hypothetical protein
MSIHSEGVLSHKRVASLGAWLAMSGMLLLPVHGIAQNIIMQDGGSTATLNFGGGSGNIGMNSWSVDTLNQSQLNQQWFWYSIVGVNGGVARTIDTLGAAGAPQTGSGNDGINDVYMAYQNSQLKVDIEYLLTGNGAGSGSADIQESIQIKNVGLSQITLSFFQYSDFNLLGGANDSVSIFGIPYDSNNPFSGYNGAIQTTGTGGSGVAEVIIAPNANFAEANTVGGLNSTLYKINNTANLTLNGNTSAGPGDVTWGLEWTATLNPDEMLDITKDKGLSLEIVPEPSTVAIIAMGAGALGLARRRKLS